MVDQTLQDTLFGLPPLSKTVAAFDKLYNSPNNATIYGFSKKVKTLQQALSLFGIRSIRTLIINYEIQKLFADAKILYCSDIQTLSTINTKQAKIALNWATSIDKSIAEDLFMVTLLSDMSKLLISKTYENDAKFAAKIAQASCCVEVLKLEKNVLGITSLEVTAKMCSFWNLDDTLTNAHLFFARRGYYSKRIKKIAIMLWCIKTALNCKERLQPKSVAKAAKIAARYNLPRFQNSIDTL